MPDAAVTRQIRAFILDRFPLAQNRRLDDRDRLLENGILDSLGVLDVVAFLEDTFEIRVSDEDLVPEHFESLERLSAFVRSRRDGTTDS